MLCKYSAGLWHQQENEQLALQNFNDSQTRQWYLHLTILRDTKQLQEGTQPALLRGGVGNVMERGLQYPEERWYSRL